MSPNSLIIVAPITLPTPGIVVIGELRLNCYAERIFCFVGGNIFKVGDNKRINLVGFVKKDTGRIAPRVCLNGIYDVNDEMIFHEEKVQSEPIVSCCLHADFKYEFMAQGGRAHLRKIIRTQSKNSKLPSRAVQFADNPLLRRQIRSCGV